MKKWLIYLFIFLGPLGNLLTPGGLPPAFRTYYFVLLGFPLFFNRIDQKQHKLFFLLLPFFLYCFVSSMLVDEEAFYATYRFFLLFFQFLFVLGAAAYINSQKEALTIYLKSFFISLIVGYTFLFGFYMKLISFETIERFSVLGQFGYGMLRFSIGSYPNEYGIVASFVSAVLLLSLSQKWKALPFSRTTTIIFLGLTYIALLLTTTRSAYVACFLSICYIFWFRKKVLLWASLFSLSVLGILKLFNISIIQFILFGFDWMQVTQGSMGSRVILWSQTWEEFSSQALWGKGFAAFADLHNVYFQLLGELGLVGICLLIGALTCAFFKRRVLLFFPKEELTPEELFAKCVRRVGMMHVLWFALTNHNLNHHLTWLIFLFYFASWISAKQATCKPLRFISEDWY